MRNFGHCGQVDVAAFDGLHHIKLAADNGIVVRQKVHFGDRNVGFPKRRLHPEFPVNRMRGFQKLPRRFAPQYVIAGRGQQFERRV